MAEVQVQAAQAAPKSSMPTDEELATLVRRYQTEYPFLGEYFSLPQVHEGASKSHNIHGATPAAKPEDAALVGATNDNAVFLAGDIDTTSNEAWFLLRLFLNLYADDLWETDTALQRARDALTELDSLMQKGDTVDGNDETEPEKKLTCMVCCEEMDRRIYLPRSLQRMRSQACSSCASPVCDDCLRTMFLAGLTDTTRMPAKCCNHFPLHMALGSKYWPLKSKAILSEEEAQAYREKFEEYRTAKRTYCPVPTCSAFIPPRLIEQAKNANAADQRIDSPVEAAPSGVACPKCTALACVSCHQLAHTGACNLVVDDVLEAALKEWGYKRCPKCSHGVRRMFGCDHMQCHCGASFCWDCMKPYYECMGDCRREEWRREREEQDARVDRSPAALRRGTERRNRRLARDRTAEELSDTLFLRDPEAFAEIALSEQDWLLDEMMDFTLALRDPEILRQNRLEDADRLFLENLEASRHRRNFDLADERKQAALEAEALVESAIADSFFLRDNEALEEMYAVAESDRLANAVDDEMFELFDPEDLIPDIPSEVDLPSEFPPELRIGVPPPPFPLEPLDSDSESESDSEDELDAQARVAFLDIPSAVGHITAAADILLEAFDPPTIDISIPALRARLDIAHLPTTLLTENPLTDPLPTINEPIPPPTAEPEDPTDAAALANLITATLPHLAPPPSHPIHGPNHDSRPEHHWRNASLDFGTEPMPERQDRTWYCRHTTTRAFLPLYPLFSGAGNEECYSCFSPLYTSEGEREAVLLETCERMYVENTLRRIGVARSARKLQFESGDYVEVAHGDWEAWEALAQELEDKVIPEHVLRRVKGEQPMRPWECAECRMVWCARCWKEESAGGAKTKVDVVVQGGPSLFD